MAGGIINLGLSAIFVGDGLSFSAAVLSLDTNALNALTGSASIASGYAFGASGSASAASGSASLSSGYAFGSSGAAATASGYAFATSGSLTNASGYAFAASGQALLSSGYAFGASGSALTTSGYAFATSGRALAASGSALAASGSALLASGYAFAASGSALLSSGSAAAASGALASMSGLIKPDTFGITIDGVGGVPNTGEMGVAYFPFNCTIQGWSMFGKVGDSGNAALDLYRNGASIVGAGNKPLLSGQQSGSATISNWTSTAISSGDALTFYLLAASGFVRLNTYIQIQK